MHLIYISTVYFISLKKSEKSEKKYEKSTVAYLCFITFMLM